MGCVGVICASVLVAMGCAASTGTRLNRDVAVASAEAGGVANACRAGGQPSENATMPLKELGPIITDWEVRAHPTMKGRKASFFIDDTIWVLRDLTRQRPKSMFDMPFFKMLKEAHDRYGLKLQLNLFYRTDYFYGTDEFTLAQVTDDYRAEFESASDWLKFGLHALQEFPDYPFVNQEYADLKFIADRTFGEIRRFAGEKSCAYAMEPHWSPINEDGCCALRDCGIKLLSTTHGRRYEYNGDPKVLPYGHAMRVENNRKPDTALFRRGYEAIDASICAYNHLSWEQHKSCVGQFKAIYDRKTRLCYKKFCNTIFLNQFKLAEIEREIKHYVGTNHVVFADHEQYFYRDYFAYQPDYAEKIFAAAKLLADNGYEFVFLEDTI